MDDWLDEDAADDAGTGEVASIERQLAVLGFREGAGAVEEASMQKGFNAGFREGSMQGETLGELQGTAQTLLDVLGPMGLCAADGVEAEEEKEATDEVDGMVIRAWVGDEFVHPESGRRAVTYRAEISSTATQISKEDAMVWRRRVREAVDALEGVELR